MPRSSACAIAVAFALLALPMHDANAQPSTRWPIHSPDRPAPRIIKPPATAWTVAPPSDATVLFGGTDLSRWEKDGGGAAAWKVENDYVASTGVKLITVDARETFRSYVESLWQDVQRSGEHPEVGDKYQALALVRELARSLTVVAFDETHDGAPTSPEPG